MSLAELEKQLTTRKAVRAANVQLVNGQLEFELILHGVGFKLDAAGKYKHTMSLLGTLFTFTQSNGDSLGITSFKIHNPYDTSVFANALKKARFSRQVFEDAYIFKVPESWYQPKYETYK